MNSERFQVQQLIELKLGCADPENLKSFKSAFEALVVDSALQSSLFSAAQSDSEGLYFKALLSISEALFAISNGRHSWAAVKLYYATFYLIRCIFSARAINIIKCSGIYSLKSSIGESPLKRDKGKFKGQEIRGDHKTVLAFYISDIGKSDKLLSNSVNGETVFEWLMRKREEVHYRAPTFYEPDFRTFDPSIHASNKLAYWVDEYLNDSDFIYCFQESHCCLAAPLKFAQEVQCELISYFGTGFMISEKQSAVIEHILAGIGIFEISKFRKLITN